MYVPKLSYEVAFLFQKGLHGIDIDWVALCEDGNVISKDPHNAFSGGKLDGVVYKFKVDSVKAGATYILKARIKGSAGTDSTGEVKIQITD